MMLRSLVVALAQAQAQAQRKPEPQPIGTFTLPAPRSVDRANEVVPLRRHFIVAGSDPLPFVFLADSNGARRQEGASWTSAVDLATDMILAQCSAHNVTVTRGFPDDAARLAVTDQERFQPTIGTDIVVLCPWGMDWPSQWQAIEIHDGVTEAPYRPPPGQRMDALVRSAVANRGRQGWTYDTWIRPDWKF